MIGYDAPQLSLTIEHLSQILGFVPRWSTPCSKTKKGGNPWNCGVTSKRCKAWGVSHPEHPGRNLSPKLSSSVGTSCQAGKCRTDTREDCGSFLLSTLKVWECGQCGHLVEDFIYIKSKYMNACLKASWEQVAAMKVDKNSGFLRLIQVTNHFSCWNQWCCLGVPPFFGPWKRIAMPRRESPWLPPFLPSRASEPLRSSLRRSRCGSAGGKTITFCLENLG